jgi:TonB-dependent SusC/RagA subfamily outer membrane receptor
MADLFTATTFIEMEFYNPGKEEMEGLYRFRLLPGQAITAMQLDLHGKYRDASVEEKWKARNAYNTIVGKRIDPALLQMEGLHQYSLRVYPIPAKSSRKVTMTIQQMLKAGATAYEYCFPLQIKDPVGQFSVTIQAQVTSAPYTVTSLLEGSFRKQSNGYAFVQEEQAFSPDGLLAFNIPMQHGKASLCTKFIQGQTHFALRYHRSIPAQLDFKPKKITIYWDASSDIRNRDIEKEISFLRQYTRFYGVQQLTIIPFNQHLLDTAVFTLQGGNHHRWLSYLRSITYDGALQLGAVDLQNTNTDAVLLFSDGKHTYGRLHHKAGKEKLFCITGSMQPNRNALQQLAAPTGGQLIELNSMNMNEAVQMAGKEQIVLMDLASASGKSIVETPLQEQENLLLLTGVMHENVDTLQLTYGNAGTIMAVEKLVLKTNDACATAAIDRIGMLYQFDSIIKTGNWQHILAFGKKHKVVTPHSSMIVLERIEDYVTYDIEPPQELKEACEALYVKKNKVDRWKLFQEWNAYDVLTNVTNRYNQRIRWWDPSHPMIALNAPGRLQGGEKNSDGGMAVKDAPADALQGKAAGLVASSRALHEVVVVGYGQHSRRLNTSSATTVIRHHEFPLAAQSVEQALAGRVPGVQVVAGVPGGSAPVQIRGLSSLSHQQPLFVLDGHPVSGNINDIVHVADIDRIEVMKSVQAAASFGSHGANGVIVVHTKKVVARPIIIARSLIG